MCRDRVGKVTYCSCACRCVWRLRRSGRKTNLGSGEAVPWRRRSLRHQPSLSGGNKITLVRLSSTDTQPSSIRNQAVYFAHTRNKQSSLALKKHSIGYDNSLRLYTKTQDQRCSVNGTFSGPSLLLRSCFVLSSFSRAPRWKHSLCCVVVVVAGHSMPLRQKRSAQLTSTSRTPAPGILAVVWLVGR